MGGMAGGGGMGTLQAMLGDMSGLKDVKIQSAVVVSYLFGALLSGAMVVRKIEEVVLLPFIALLRAFPKSATCTDAHRAVALLIEMLADDHALRARPARELVSALVRFGTAGTCPAPAGTLAAGEGEVAARVTRLLKPVRPLPTAVVLAICLASALLVAVPITLLVA